MSQSKYIKELKTQLHWPLYKGTPIYGKPKPGNMPSFINAPSEAAISKDPEWLNYTQTHNNSPNNIRRVYFFPNCIALVHYIRLGKRRLEWIPLQNKATGALDYNDIESIMRLFSTPWVCSNIEEIFFASCMVGENAKMLASVFSQVNQPEAGAPLKSRYPKLRGIGKIAADGSKLIEALEQSIRRRSDSDPYALATDVIGTSDAMNQLRKAGKADYSLMYPNPADNYSVREGEYIFDTKLKAVLESMSQAVKSKAKPTEAKGKTEKNQLEQCLDGLERKDASVIPLAFFNISDDKIENLLDDFSDKGKAHYKEVLGIGGDKNERR